MLDPDSLQLVVDSLSRLVAGQGSGVENLELSDKVNLWRTIGSSGVIILLFILERLVTYLGSKRDRKQRFLQEIILKPNLENISEFYEKFYEVLKNSINSIRATEGIGDTIDLKKRESLAELKSFKRDFDIEFVSLVRSVDKAKADTLTDILNLVEDIATESLTNGLLSDVDLHETKRKILLVKSSFYETMYHIKSSWFVLTKRAWPRLKWVFGIVITLGFVYSLSKFFLV